MGNKLATGRSIERWGRLEGGGGGRIMKELRVVGVCESVEGNRREMGR